MTSKRTTYHFHLGFREALLDLKALRVPFPLALLACRENRVAPECPVTPGGRGDPAFRVGVASTWGTFHILLLHSNLSFLDLLWCGHHMCRQEPHTTKIISTVKFDPLPHDLPLSPGDPIGPGGPPAPVSPGGPREPSCPGYPSFPGFPG